jgi:hypothetical protein
MKLAYLLLALGAGAAPDDYRVKDGEYHMNATRFDIPITIKPERRSEVSRLELWLSRDRGKTWEPAGTATPDKSGFPFMTSGDGPYWFAVVVIDQAGRRDPPLLAQVPPNQIQKVYIDTKQPQISLSAQRHGDDMEVTWNIAEDNLHTGSMRLEYQADGGPWTNATFMPAPNGTTHIPAPGAGAVHVRLTAADLASNQSVQVADVGAAQVSPVGREVSTYKTISGSPAGFDNSAPIPLPAIGTQTAPSPPIPTNPDPRVMPLNQQSSSPPALPLASTNPVAPPAMPSVPAPSSPAYSAQVPQVQIVNKRQVKLDFDVAKFGPSGIGSVEVYATFDDGRTWSTDLVQPDPPRAVPSLDANSGEPFRKLVTVQEVKLPPDTNSVGPLRGSVTLQLEKEGVVYGFCLIVKSRARMGKPPPRSGEAPHVRVELDTTPPVAELYAPDPDPSRPTALTLRWSAEDKHLAANPIKIEWAPRKEGPWQVIGSPELPNTGRFTWELTREVPPSVFLKLTVRDAAGNKAEAVTNEAVLVDLTMPEVGNVQLQMGH